jgi:hypothetical protein
LVIIEGWEADWVLGRKYNFTYQFKHVKWCRKLVKKIRRSFKKRKHMYVSYLKLYYFDSHYPLDYNEVSWRRLNRHCLLNYHKCLFLMDFLNEFNCNIRDLKLTLNNPMVVKLDIYYDFTFLFIVILHLNS